MAIDITVIIPCLNASHWIRDTLASVIAQRCASLEVIAIDDGSTDGTGEIIRKDFSFVRLETTANRGASKARNLGTSLASGEYIQYLDADDLLAPGKLNLQIAALENSNADVAYGDWQQLVERAREFTPGAFVARRMQRDAELELFDNFWCPPAAYLFRRRIVEAVGGWNEGLPVIQDARFALDCALRGGTFVYCPGIMAQYRIHSGISLSRRDPKAFVRDVYRNATEVREWWKSHGGLTNARSQLLKKVLGQVARSSYENDPELFQAAYVALLDIEPNYVPASPKHLAIATRILGYPNAEGLAARYRQAKKTLQLCCAFSGTIFSK